MQQAFWIAFYLDCLAAVYFSYQSAMHVFVYFANKRLGHTESFFFSARYLALAAVFIVISVIGYILKKKFAATFQALLIVGFPYFILTLYGLFAIIILIFGRGRWN